MRGVEGEGLREVMEYERVKDVYMVNKKMVEDRGGNVRMVEGVGGVKEIS